MYTYEVRIVWMEGNKDIITYILPLETDLDHDKVCRLFENSGRFIGQVLEIENE